MWRGEIAVAGGRLPRARAVLDLVGHGTRRLASGLRVRSCMWKEARRGRALLRYVICKGH